ncbi:MAG TPA: ABC transporter ATP-binding protein [Acidobacteriaceae bacterium]|nr:ABC transporter ATP-binding protein [Acidobacteriaceae bacterium]
MSGTEFIVVETLAETMAGPGRAGTPAIAVRDVTMRFPLPKRYREWVLHPLRARRVVTALQHASVEIQAGDRIAVMGPNGAGKTTLLKLISGLLFPSDGDVTVKGLSTLHHNAAARKSVGFVFNEERSFYWRLTGVQNLEFFGALDNLRGKELKERIGELMRLVGLEAAGDQQVGGYSSGMKQRLALARVLIADPEVLILDEPTRALDPVASEEMVELILKDIHRGAQKTLLIATHRPEEAVRLCNKVMVIDGGHIRGFVNLSRLKEEGTALLDYYRQCIAGERAA